MDSEESLLLLVCEAESAEPLTALLRSSGIAAQASSRRNLDGSAAPWVVAGLTTLSSLPAIMRALSQFLTRNSVKRLEYGDFAIENPRPEDVDVIIGRLASREEEGHGKST